MDASSEAADQIVRMTLQGAEVALRITGAGARDAAAMLAAAMASSQKTRGKARLAALLRSGKELRVFPIRRADLGTFARRRAATASCTPSSSRRTIPNRSTCWCGPRTRAR